ncbi:hypothetical protein VXE64_21830 [Mycolicibacterium cosmeticum]
MQPLDEETRVRDVAVQCRGLPSHRPSAAGLPGRPFALSLCESWDHHSEVLVQRVEQLDGLSDIRVSHNGHRDTRSRTALPKGTG